MWSEEAAERLERLAAVMSSVAFKGSNAANDCADIRAALAEIERQAQRIAKLELQAELREQCFHENLVRAEAAEAREAKLREAGDYLAAEVGQQGWRPGEGHLIDALEMWVSAGGRVEAARR